MVNKVKVEKVKVTELEVFHERDHLESRSFHLNNEVLLITTLVNKIQSRRLVNEM